MLLDKVLRRLSGAGVEVSPKVVVKRRALEQYGAALAVETSLSGRSSWKEIRPDLERAEKQLRRALRAAPLFRDAHRALGRNLWFQGRPADADIEFAAAENMRFEIAPLLFSCARKARRARASIAIRRLLQ